MRTVCLSLDVDMVDYLSANDGLNEMESAVPQIIDFLNEKRILSSWYFRIDDRMGAEYGSNDYIFIQHQDIIQSMREKGHEVAWHFHSYIKKGEKWTQNPNAESVAEELKRNLVLAKKHGLKALRMGWAYHTSQTYSILDQFGLDYDSSALPRPNYAWENGLRNWETTGQKPFYPSKRDYRVAGVDVYRTLQIPINTVGLSIPSDTIPNMKRYINPVYHSEAFNRAFENNTLENTVMVMHPYEVLPNSNKHPLLSFSMDTFKKNIESLLNQGYTFITVNQYKKSQEHVGNSE